MRLNTAQRNPGDGEEQAGEKTAGRGQAALACDYGMLLLPTSLASQGNSPAEKKSYYSAVAIITLEFCQLVG